MVPTALALADGGRRALALGGIQRISQLQLLQPFFGFALAATLLGEPVTGAMLAVALGVGVTHHPKAVATLERYYATRGGVTEAILAVHTLRSGLIPPTLNLDEPAFPDHDIVSGAARKAEVSAVLSNSFGFGGHNAAVLLRRGR